MFEDITALKPAIQSRVCLPYALSQRDLILEWTSCTLIGQKPKRLKPKELVFRARRWDTLEGCGNTEKTRDRGSSPSGWSMPWLIWCICWEHYLRSPSDLKDFHTDVKYLILLKFLLSSFHLLLSRNKRHMFNSQFSTKCSVVFVCPPQGHCCYCRREIHWAMLCFLKIDMFSPSFRKGLGYRKYQLNGNLPSVVFCLHYWPLMRLLFMYLLAQVKVFRSNLYYGFFIVILEHHRCWVQHFPIQIYTQSFPANINTAWIQKRLWKILCGEGERQRNISWA
jgi:hypothetical protein